MYGCVWGSGGGGGDLLWVSSGFTWCGCDMVWFSVGVCALWLGVFVLVWMRFGIGTVYGVYRSGM